MCPPEAAPPEPGQGRAALLPHRLMSGAAECTTSDPHGPRNPTSPGKATPGWQGTPGLRALGAALLPQDSGTELVLPLKGWGGPRDGCTPAHTQTCVHLKSARGGLRRAMRGPGHHRDPALATWPPNTWCPVTKNADKGLEASGCGSRMSKPSQGFPGSGWGPAAPAPGPGLTKECGPDAPTRECPALQCWGTSTPPPGAPGPPLLHPAPLRLRIPCAGEALR